ncbi:MAG: glycosyltransferase [Anaerolineae bacterium]|nr:glycosyltransferase [Anaerolineae bacterium]
MNILFIVPYTPNLIRVRSYQLLRGLARHGHSVTLAALWSSDEERADLARLEGEGIRVIARRLTRQRSALNCTQTLPTGTPLQANFCWEPSLAADIDAALTRQAFDVVHVEHLRGARYGLEVLAQRGASRSPAVVWDSVDSISYLFEQAAHASRSVRGRLMTRLELGRTRRHEGRLVAAFDRTLVTSEIDRQALLTLAETYTPRAAWPPVTVVPNGVDLAYFTPTDEPREPATLAFSGKMSYHANVTAAAYLLEQVMPHVWAARPTVRVQIVGKDPPPLLRRMADDALGVVELTGAVPDMRPYLRRATLAVAPIPYGAGIQNKVLEAMACGAPVVATRQAVSALAARPGVDVAVADEPTAMSVAILNLIDDAPRREALGRAGRVYVERHHAWERIVHRLENVYDDTRDVNAALSASAEAAADGYARMGALKPMSDAAH